MKLVKISEAEKEVMQIIWASGNPMTSAEILGNLPPERELKITTVLTFLTRLTEKGLVSFEKKGKKNYYVPLITEKEYKKFESKSFLSTIHGGSIKSFIAALCDDGEISREEIEELKIWFSQR
jgi:BlaI family penicillinase repressor